MDKTLDMVAALRVGDEAMNGVADYDELLELEFTPAQAALVFHCIDAMVRRLSNQQIGRCEHDIHCAAEAMSYMLRLSGKAGSYAEKHRIVVLP